jgi:hypothetical protein
MPTRAQSVSVCQERCRVLNRQAVVVRWPGGACTQSAHQPGLNLCAQELLLP